MPCYELPEFIPITFRDLIPKMQKRILEDIPDINQDKTLFYLEFEYPPEEAVNCSSTGNRSVPPFLGVFSYGSMMSDICESYNPPTGSSVNYLFACKNAEGFCDYNLFICHENNLTSFHAWMNENGSIRYSEIPDGKIQYISTPYANIANMKVSEMYNYILQQYELYNSGKECCIDVYDTNESPGEFIKNQEEEPLDLYF